MRFEKISIFIQAAWIFIIQILADTGVDWGIQICLSGKRYNISKSKCTGSDSGTVGGAAGVWFAEPLKIDRACFSHGVWVLYKEWCQENPVIWTTGSKSKVPGCMEKKLLDKVSGIVFLGNEANGTSISTCKQRLFLETLEAGRNWRMLDPELSVISWGHKASYIFKQQYSDVNSETCLKGGRSFFKTFKINATTARSVGFSIREDDCLKSSTNSIVASSDFRTLHSTAHLPFKHSVLNCSAVLKKCSNKNQCDWTQPVGDILHDVNEQSSRLALKFHAHAFGNLRLPALHLEQWKLLEISKKLFEKACPTEIVSAAFLDSMLVFGQLLISESAKAFPRPVMDPSMFQRIQNVLQKCSASLKPFEFEEANACSKNRQVLIKVKYLNGTKGPAPVHIPEDVRNIAGIYDLIIEVTWKLFLFAHYTCANHFKQFPSDFSSFYAAWLALITRDLQARWTNPGKSLKMLELVLGSIDLSSTIHHLDHCVGAAQAQSVYHGWLKRPFQAKGIRKLMASNDLIWDGNAYCMDSYAYPALRLGYPIEQCGLAWNED